MDTSPAAAAASPGRVEGDAVLESSGTADAVEDAGVANNGGSVDDNSVDDNSVDVMLLLGQFRDLAAHPKTRNTLIQDATSLGGLVLLLNDSNPDIVEHTLEIFLLLSKSKVSLLVIYTSVPNLLINQSICL